MMATTGAPVGLTIHNDVERFHIETCLPSIETNGRQILVPELGPDAQDLHSFGRVALDQKVVFHDLSAFVDVGKVCRKFKHAGKL